MRDLVKYSKRMVDAIREKYFPTVHNHMFLEATRNVWFPQEEVFFCLTLFGDSNIGIVAQDFSDNILSEDTNFLDPETVEDFLLKDWRKYQILPENDSMYKHLAKNYYRKKIGEAFAEGINTLKEFVIVFNSYIKENASQIQLDQLDVEWERYTPRMKTITLSPTYELEKMIVTEVRHF